MRIGTSHFKSLSAANRYYAPQGFSPADVTRKLEEREIFIGKPAAGPAEKIVLVDSGTRYAIETQP